MSDLTQEEILKILAEPDSPKKTRTRKSDTDDRTITGWFKLPHTSSRNCEVELHDENDRPRNKGMTAIINEVAVCRICYLAEMDKLTEDD